MSSRPPGILVAVFLLLVSAVAAGLPSATWVNETAQGVSSLPPVGQTTSSTQRRNVIRGEREAAVITRLPHMKTEICRAERLEQTVKVRGCLQRTVVNRYCYGQCNSFFIPRAATRSRRTATTGGKLRTAGLVPNPVGIARRPTKSLGWSAFRSCSFCRPKRVEWVTVGLNCPRRRRSYRRRRVQIVKECACTALTLD